MESTILQTVSDFLVQWLPIITSVVGSFALIATVTPNTTDDRIVQVILDIVNFLAGNIGKSKNKVDEV